MTMVNTTNNLDFFFEVSFPQKQSSHNSKQEQDPTKNNMQRKKKTSPRYSIITTQNPEPNIPSPIILAEIKNKKDEKFLPPELLDSGESIDRVNIATPSSLLRFGGRVSGFVDAGFNLAVGYMGSSALVSSGRGAGFVWERRWASRFIGAN